MSQFVLIDHSLKGVGGHHFEYAYHILSEAQQRGRDVVLAAHHDFQQLDALPAEWKVHALFKQDTYSPHSVYFRHPYRPGKLQTGKSASKNQGGLLSTLKNWWTSRGQQTHRRGFAAACEALFQQVQLTAGDEVFIPTLSELDMAGLMDFLSRSPQPADVNWRLQFHFDVCDGRPDEFAAQSARGESMRASLLDSLQRAGGAKLHFYNTTHELTAQYNQLQTADFQTLHYPVNPKFSPRTLPTHAAPNRRLRVTCGGYFRREKGRKRFASLIGDLAPDLLSQKAVQLSAQCKPRQMSKILRHTPGANGVPADSVVCAPHPLGVDEYVDYIKQSDIGLFLYDGRRYFSRCSGVLVEMLAAGVPVITPAACWLEEQYAAANQEYFQQLLRSEPALSVVTSDNTALTSASQTLLKTSRLKESADAIVQLNWPQSDSDAAKQDFVRLHCMQLDSRDVVLDHYRTVMRSSVASTSMLLPLDKRCRSIRIHAETAYGKTACEVTTKLHQLRSPASSSHRPMGSVGLAFDQEEDIARLIRDMVRHHDHYQQAARSFAQAWRQKHSPTAVLNSFTPSHQAQQTGRAA